MKISKTLVLMLWWIFTLLWLWLMFVSADEKELGMNPGNSIHHVQNVILLSGSNKSTLRKEGDGVLWIEANSFVISQTWNTVKNSMVNNPKNSSILWWINNQINGWSFNVILWGQSNKMSKDSRESTNSIILWWSGNTIAPKSNGNSDYSVILWWLGNELKWSYSVVWWEDNKLNWDYSIVLWKNNTVVGNFVSSLWSGAVIKANNSFLWTDGSQWGKELTQSNVFAIVSRRWLVVNTGKAHNYAQLTIWGPLIVYKSSSDLGECNSWYKWVVKVVDWDSGQKCFCSCDGQSWHSLYGQWTCVWKCDTWLKPVCGTDVSKICSSTPYSYSGSCVVGRIEQWIWAYVVTKDDKVHRSCQTNNWSVAQCSWTVNNVIGTCSLG